MYDQEGKFVTAIHVGAHQGGDPILGRFSYSAALSPQCPQCGSAWKKNPVSSALYTFRGLYSESNFARTSFFQSSIGRRQLRQGLSANRFRHDCMLLLEASDKTDVSLKASLKPRSRRSAIEVAFSLSTARVMGNCGHVARVCWNQLRKASSRAGKREEEKRFLESVDEPLFHSLKMTPF